MLLSLKYLLPRQGGALVGLEFAMPFAGGSRRDLIVALLESAQSQGQRLTYHDLMLILLVSKATLKRDMRVLRKFCLAKGLGLRPFSRRLDGAAKLGFATLVSSGHGERRFALIKGGDPLILDDSGIPALRRSRLVSLVYEAHDRGERLGYGELSAMLFTSRSTLKRDVAHINKTGSTRLPIADMRRSVRGAAPKRARALAASGYGVVNL